MPGFKKLPPDLRGGDCGHKSPGAGVGPWAGRDRLKQEQCSGGRVDTREGAWGMVGLQWHPERRGG